MSRIARSTQQIFGAVGNVGTGGFGAAANGVLTTELATSSSLSTLQTGQSGMWAGGWLGAVLGSTKFPPLEDMNAINYVVTTQLAYILQQGIPEYDAGTTYYVNNVVMNPGTFQLYGSKINSNTGNALTNTSDWQFLADLSSLSPVANVYTGGTTTGSASAQTLALLNPATGFSLSNNGQVIVFTSGFAPIGATTLAITSPSVAATAIKKPGTGGSLVNLTGGEWGANETVSVAVNTTAGCYELLESPPLGNIAILNTDSTNFAASGGNLAFGSAPVLPSASTGTTQSVGDATTKFATTAFVNPASSLATNGHRQNADGSIEQWGVVATTGGSGSISYPISFPTAVYNIAMTGDVEQNLFFSGGDPGLSSFGWGNGAGTSMNLFWRAIGK